MKWTPEAEDAIKKVPFFVRKRVRARVEKEAAAENRHVVSLSEVQATKTRYLTDMTSEVKGYRLDTCFGPNGCPNRANPSDRLMERIEALLKQADLLAFLKIQVGDGLKFHHEFRVTLADCPNACSQPQIKDIGILGACIPKITDLKCSACGACEDFCKEKAVFLGPERGGPHINPRRCVGCGGCIPICPTGTLAEDRRGFRIQVGGKLGRHPALAREIPGLFDEDGVVAVVGACVDFYKSRSRGGKRFADIIEKAGLQRLIASAPCFNSAVDGIAT